MHPFHSMTWIRVRLRSETAPTLLALTFVLLGISTVSGWLLPLNFNQSQISTLPTVKRSSQPTWTPLPNGAPSGALLLGYDFTGATRVPDYIIVGPIIKLNFSAGCTVKPSEERRTIDGNNNGNSSGTVSSGLRLPMPLPSLTDLSSLIPPYLIHTATANPRKSNATNDGRQGIEMLTSPVMNISIGTIALCDFQAAYTAGCRTYTSILKQHAQIRAIVDSVYSPGSGSGSDSAGSAGYYPPVRLLMFTTPSDSADEFGSPFGQKFDDYWMYKPDDLELMLIGTQTGEMLSKLTWQGHSFNNSTTLLQLSQPTSAITHHQHHQHQHPFALSVMEDGPVQPVILAAVRSPGPWNRAYSSKLFTWIDVLTYIFFIPCAAAAIYIGIVRFKYKHNTFGRTVLLLGCAIGLIAGATMPFGSVYSNAINVVRYLAQWLVATIVAVLAIQVVHLLNQVANEVMLPAAELDRKATGEDGDIKQDNEDSGGGGGGGGGGGSGDGSRGSGGGTGSTGRSNRSARGVDAAGGQWSTDPMALIDSVTTAALAGSSTTPRSRAASAGVRSQRGVFGGDTGSATATAGTFGGITAALKSIFRSFMSRFSSSSNNSNNSNRVHSTADRPFNAADTAAVFPQSRLRSQASGPPTRSGTNNTGTSTGTSTLSKCPLCRRAIPMSVYFRLLWICNTVSFVSIFVSFMHFSTRVVDLYTTIPAQDYANFIMEVYIFPLMVLIQASVYLVTFSLINHRLKTIQKNRVKYLSMLIRSKSTTYNSGNAYGNAGMVTLLPDRLTGQHQAQYQTQEQLQLQQQQLQQQQQQQSSSDESPVVPVQLFEDTSGLRYMLLMCLCISFGYILYSVAQVLCATTMRYSIRGMVIIRIMSNLAVLLSYGLVVWVVVCKDWILEMYQKAGAASRSPLSSDLLIPQMLIDSMLPVQQQQQQQQHYQQLQHSGIVNPVVIGSQPYGNVSSQHTVPENHVPTPFQPSWVPLGLAFATGQGQSLITHAPVHVPTHMLIPQLPPLGQAISTGSLRNSLSGASGGQRGSLSWRRNSRKVGPPEQPQPQPVSASTAAGHGTQLPAISTYYQQQSHPTVTSTSVLQVPPQAVVHGGGTALPAGMQVPAAVSDLSRNPRFGTGMISIPVLSPHGVLNVAVAPDPKTTRELQRQQTLQHHQQRLQPLLQQSQPHQQGAFIGTAPHVRSPSMHQSRHHHEQPNAEQAPLFDRLADGFRRLSNVFGSFSSTDDQHPMLAQQKSNAQRQGSDQSRIIPQSAITPLSTQNVTFGTRGTGGIGVSSSGGGGEDAQNTPVMTATSAATSTPQGHQRPHALSPRQHQQQHRRERLSSRTRIFASIMKRKSISGMKLPLHDDEHAAIEMGNINGEHMDDGNYQRRPMAGSAWSRSWSLESLSRFKSMFGTGSQHSPLYHVQPEPVSAQPDADVMPQTAASKTMPTKVPPPPRLNLQSFQSSAQEHRLQQPSPGVPATAKSEPNASALSFLQQPPSSSLGPGRTISAVRSIPSQLALNSSANSSGDNVSHGVNPLELEHISTYIAMLRAKRAAGSSTGTTATDPNTVAAASSTTAFSGGLKTGISTISELPNQSMDRIGSQYDALLPYQQQQLQLQQQQQQQQQQTAGDMNSERNRNSQEFTRGRLRSISEPRRSSQQTIPSIQKSKESSFSVAVDDNGQAPHPAESTSEMSQNHLQLHPSKSVSPRPPSLAEPVPHRIHQRLSTITASEIPSQQLDFTYTTDPQQHPLSTTQLPSLSSTNSIYAPDLQPIQQQQQLLQLQIEQLQQQQVQLHQYQMALAAAAAVGGGVGGGVQMAHPLGEPAVYLQPYVDPQAMSVPLPATQPPPMYSIPISEIDQSYPSHLMMSSALSQLQGIQPVPVISAGYHPRQYGHAHTTTVGHGLRPAPRRTAGALSSASHHHHQHAFSMINPLAQQQQQQQQQQQLYNLPQPPHSASALSNVTGQIATTSTTTSSSAVNPPDGGTDIPASVTAVPLSAPPVVLPPEPGHAFSRVQAQSVYQQQQNQQNLDEFGGGLMATVSRGSSRRTFRLSPSNNQRTQQNNDIAPL